MKINTYLTKVNFNTLKNKVNKYIVIHYTGNDGDTALGNCKYFYSVNRNASAHYFVDETGVWQCVNDNDAAWHCGAKSYKHPYCRNSNSIGIELCSIKNGSYYFAEKTVENAAELTKELMEKYNIPIENVIRHYDVTGKICPEPFVRNERDWYAFKEKLKGKEDSEMVSEGKAVVNGREYKIDRINKDGMNYIRVQNFGNMGFEVGYDKDTKAVKIDNKISSININNRNVEAVNLGGYNYVKVRDIAEIMGKKVEFDGNNIVIR